MAKNKAAEKFKAITYSQWTIQRLVEDMENV
jgi:hypothetical protein